MKDGNKTQFAEIIMGAAELYGKDMSKAAIGIWFNALKGYDIETISSAFSAHVSNPDVGQYFPKPADIIRAVEGTSTDASYIGWTKVDEAIRVVGPYKTVVFDDPIIHAVVDDMGGWISFGEKTEKEWPFVGKEFQGRYQGYKARGGVPAYNQKLIGIHEAKNRQSGFETDTPLLIGDKNKAKKVYLEATSKNLEITFADTILENMKQLETKESE